MSRFYGEIGFISTIESEPGIWTDKMIERKYRGEIKKNFRKWSSSEHLNDDVNISNTVSVLADTYMYNNIYAMKYIRLGGVLWKITDIEIQRPRLILSIGGLYNG